MKKLATNSKSLAFLTVLGLLVFTSSCKKARSCETNNTYTLTVQNTLANGNLSINVDKNFTALNTPGEYVVDPGKSVNINVSAGSHIIKAKSIISFCSGGRCSVTISGFPDKNINESACEGAFLAY